MAILLAAGNRRMMNRGPVRTFLARALLGLACLAASRVPAGETSAADTPVRLPRPPFAYSFRGPGKAKPAPSRVRLVRVSERRNKITDQEQWFRTNGLSLPVVESNLPGGNHGELPDGAPRTYRGKGLIQAIRDGESLLLIYGTDYSRGQFLLVYDTAGGQVRSAFDFATYLQPPRFAKGERAFVDEGLQWADVEDGVLYVSSFHRTYAASSGGLNGYLTALDLKIGRLLWRSRPLVCNASTFLVRSNVILTGYGFTREPDYLYLLDRRTGAVLQTVRLRSGPEFLLAKGDRIYVRSYDTDYVFRLTPGS